MKKFSIIFLALVALLSGCQDDIDLELKDDQSGIMVVEAFLRNISTREAIKLTRTTSYYDSEPEELVTGALVTITEDNGSPFQLKESTNPDSLGYYIKPANFSMKIGSAYTLTISIDDEIYTAVSELKPIPNIDSMEVFYNDIQFLFASEFVPIAPVDTIYDINITYTELPQKGDVYLFKYYVNDTLASFYPRDYVYFDDEFLNGEVTGSVQQFPKIQADYGDKITIEMLSISPELATFYEVLFNQTDLSGNLFASSPPANVPTNISNGARGNFQVSQPTYKSTIFKPLFQE